jgi:hypothetical protein
MIKTTNGMYTIEVTQAELIALLEAREAANAAAPKKKGIRKYFFNKHDFFDVKTAVIRESMKLVFNSVQFGGLYFLFQEILKLTK